MEKYKMCRARVPPGQVQNHWSKAHLPAKSLTENFATFVDRVLVNNNSGFTICLVEEDFTSSTPSQEASQLPFPHFMELMPEPTADADLGPAMMIEQERVTEPTITWEPKPDLTSDQVWEQMVCPYFSCLHWFCPVLSLHWFHPVPVLLCSLLNSNCHSSSKTSFLGPAYTGSCQSLS